MGSEKRKCEEESKPRGADTKGGKGIMIGEAGDKNGEDE